MKEPRTNQQGAHEGVAEGDSWWRARAVVGGKGSGRSQGMEGKRQWRAAVVESKGGGG